MTLQVEIQGELLAVKFFEPAEEIIADVVLVHGFTGSKEDFSDVAPLLAAAGLRVLTFDNRGQHESSHSKRIDGYSMESLGKDVIELSTFFGLSKPHLLGHSFGGLIAQQATMLSPGTWSSLTLMCSGPGGRADWLEDPQFQNLKNETKEDIWTRYLERDRLGHAKFDLLRKRWLYSDADSTMAYRHHLNHQPSLIKEIAAFGIKSHVLFGERDDAWPIEEQRMMAKELGAMLTVLPDCGHCPNEENPDLLAANLLAFWKSE